MRITGGSLKGRRLRVPRSGVRPTQDQVREALFSMLGASVVDARFLDLFAGSGAVGLEAWSRGAAQVYWVEHHRATHACLKQNVAELCEDAGEALRADVLKLKGAAALGGPFDIIFADPPYEDIRSKEEGESLLLERVREMIERGELLAAEGLLIFEQPMRIPVPERPGWSLIRDRKYGKTRILIFCWEPPGRDDAC